MTTENTCVVCNEKVDLGQPYLINQVADTSEEVMKTHPQGDRNRTFDGSSVAHVDCRGFVMIVLSDFGKWRPVNIPKGKTVEDCIPRCKECKEKVYRSDLLGCECKRIGRMSAI